MFFFFFLIKVITEITEFLFQLCHSFFCDPDLWSEFVSLEFNRSFVIVFPGTGVILEILPVFVDLIPIMQHHDAGGPDAVLVTFS